MASDRDTACITFADVYAANKIKYLRLKYASSCKIGGGSTGSKIKTYIFGDSFVGPFTLIKNNEVYVHKFKGATAKGLTKPSNENKKFIEDILLKRSDPPKCIVFNFGNVDVHLSFYYNIFVKNESTFGHTNMVSDSSIKIFASNIAKKYVDFIKQFDAKHIYIITPMYSPINDDNIVESLIRYKSVHSTIKDRLNKQQIDLYFNRTIRNKVVDSFCRSVKKSVSGTKIEVVDLNPIVSQNGTIKKEYVDFAAYNIHLRWGPLIKEYSKIFGRCGIKEKYINDLEKTEKLYEEYKLKELEKYNEYVD